MNKGATTTTTTYNNMKLQVTGMVLKQNQKYKTRQLVRDRGKY